MISLSQRKLFVKRNFEITTKGLNYEFSNLFDRLKIEIPFEDIGLRRIDQTTSNKLYILFSAFMTLVFLSKTYYLIIGENNDFGMTIAVFLIMLFAYSIAYYDNKDFVLIECSNPNYIEFYSKRPSKGEVDTFINTLHAKTKEFLINKYTVRDFNIPLDNQIEQVYWLKNRDLITNEQYEAIVQDWNAPKSVNIIGFKNKNIN